MMDAKKPENYQFSDERPIEAFDSPRKPKRNKYAFACAMLASMTSILLGYDVGVMSGAGPFIQDDLKISDVQLEIVMGIIELYSLLGAAAAGRTSDWVGRRYTIVIAAALFFAGALFSAVATNYAILMVGRFIAGLGVGFALLIAPVYTTELAPASSRGFLTSFPEVFINAGVCLGFISNYAFENLPQNLGWRVMVGLGVVPPIFLGLGVLTMPESPRWLVLQGRLGEAKRILDKTSDSKEEAQLRLNEIKEAAGIPEECNDDVVQVSKRSHGEDVWKEFFIRPTPTVLHILICGVGIHFFQQASGIDAVVLYSPKIFGKAGITSNSHKLLATVAVGFCKTVFVLVATFLLDRVGRRPLLLSSVGGMIVSLGTLGTCLTIIDRSQKKVMWAVALAIVSMLSFVSTFEIGMGPIAWVYSSEIFPLRLRAQGTAMGTAMNRLMSGVISMTFLSLTKAITTGGAFFLFMGVAIASWIFFYTLYPETQGKTLEEMQVLFGTFFKWRSTMRELENNKVVSKEDSNSDSDGHIELGTTTIG
ncbi:polyol transporter 5-like [Rhododendron vialii]|uniref:polyol transporter 5-like n=1 Tax=Rhododendron vialii TaxID=182163 RepID=UPI00265EAAD1|nr:polyol transporter 5-like [Rhododendron vialii]